MMSILLVGRLVLFAQTRSCSEYPENQVEHCNIRPKSIPKSRKISFSFDIHITCPIILEFCIEHDSMTVVLYAKLQNDLWNEENSYEDLYFAKFEF